MPNVRMNELVIDSFPLQRQGCHPPAPQQNLRCVVVIDHNRQIDAFTEAMRALRFDVAWRRVDDQPHKPATDRPAVELVLIDRDLPASTRAAALHAIGVAPAPASSVSAPRDDASWRPRTITERWASFILHVVSAAHDLKTMGAWARAAGTSRSVLCECCRLVHVAPRDARDFARMLRVVLNGPPRWQPEAMLDLADDRTLTKLLGRAGLIDWRFARRPTMEEFLTRQQWIPHDNPALLALHARIS